MDRQNGVSLETKFFDRDEIISIECMQDGGMVINILLKLYAIYGEVGGRLAPENGESKERTFSTLAKATRSRCTDIRRAIDVLMEKGILDERKDGLYLLLCYPEDNPFRSNPFG